MTRSPKATVSTREAAELLGRNPHRLHEWLAAEMGVRPLRQERIGRSTVTLWSVEEITEALRRRYARQVMTRGAEISTLAVECSDSGPAEVA